MSWFYAVILVALAVSYLLNQLNEQIAPTSKAFQQFNLQRIAEFATRPSEFEVVMLGNSRLKYATETESRLADMSRARGINIEYLRIIQEEAQFADFEQFLAPILELEPDLVLLQAPLLVMDRVDYWDWRQIQQLVVAAVRGDSAKWQPTTRDQHRLQFNTPCLVRRHGMTQEQMATALLDERIRRTTRRATYDLNGVNAAAARDFIARASERGIEVVILGIPKTDSLTEALKDFHGERLIAGRVLADPASAWTFPRSIPDEEYCDLIHMDSSARRLYSEWLVERVIERASPQDSSESDFDRAALKRINRS